jgi:hypothetical protein
MKDKQFALIAAILLISLAPALAQRGMRNYDPATETTVKGTIAEVKQVGGRRGWNGTHLVLKTQAGQMDVHVGPSAYIAAQGFSFAPGEQVEVLGSQVKMGDSDALIAREIRKQDKLLTLRDAQGMPRWSGGRRRGN